MTIEISTLSKASEVIIGKISKFLSAYGHPCITDHGNGVLEENYTKYDLKTKEGRKAYREKCCGSLAYGAMLEIKNIAERNPREKLHSLRVRIKFMEPWASLILLIDELDFQIETLDFMSS